MTEYESGPPQPPPALFWLYGLVAAGLFSIGVAAGDLFFSGDRSLNFAFQVDVEHCERAFPDVLTDASALDGFDGCMQRPAAIGGLVVLAGAALVLAGALALMGVLPLVDRWRSRWRRGRLRVAGAQHEFDRLCDESGLFGRRRPVLFVAGPPVRQAFTTALPGRRPIVVLPAAVALAHADNRRFDPIVRHELAHVLARDVTWVSALRGVLWVTVPAVIIGAIPDLLAVEMINQLSATLFVEAVVLVAATATLAAALLRGREYEADRYAVSAGSGSALAHLLADAAVRTRRPVVRRILASHPDPAARISALPDSASSRAAPRWSVRDDLVQAVAFGFVAVTVMGATYSLTALLNFPAQWLPAVVASAVGGVLLGAGLTPSLYRRAVSAHQTGRTVAWGRTLSGTAVGVVVGMFISPVTSVPGRAAFLPTDGHAGTTILAVALLAAASVGAVALCAGLADAMSTAPAPRVLRAMTYVAAAGATFAAFWPVTSVASLLSLPGLLRSWLVYGLPSGRWPIFFATVPLAALVLLTRRQRAAVRGPHQPARATDRDTTRASTVQAVTVAVVAFVLASVVSVLRSHLVRPGTTDLAIHLNQERAWIGALAGLIVLVIVGGRGGSRSLPLAILLACSATLSFGAVQFVDGGLTVRSWSLIDLRHSVTTPGVWLAYLILLAAPILVLLPRTRPTASGAAPDPAPSVPPTTGRLRAVGKIGLAAAATVAGTALIIGLGLPLGSVHRTTDDVTTADDVAASKATTPAPAIPSTTGTIAASPDRILTDKQAQSVAASVQTTLPGYWKPRPATTSSDDSPVKPAGCRPIATDAYITALQPHQRARGSANFNTVSTLSSVVSSALFVKVYAYDEKVPPSLFAAADAARAACPRLTTAIASGGTLTIDFEDRPAPAIGDQAWRVIEHLTLRSAGTRIPSTASYTIVSVGNHLITVLELAVLENLDETVADRALTTALTKLHTVIG